MEAPAVVLVPSTCSNAGAPRKTNADAVGPARSAASRVPCFAAIGLLILFAAFPARAEELASWSVVELGNCSDVNSGEPARALRDALARQLAGAVAPEEQTAKALGGSATASLDQGERLLASARLDLTGGDLDRASRELEQARETFIAIAPSVDRWKGVRDTQTLRAWIDLKQGRRKEAEAALREILVVDPDFTPSELLYPPMIRNLNQAVWKSMRGEPRSKLTVRTEPPGLPVYVGERPLGDAPVKVELPSGHYRVEAAFSSARGMPQEIDLDGPTQVSLSAKVEGAVWPEHGPCLTVSENRSERLRLLEHVASVVRAQKLVGIEIEEPSPGERYLAATVLDATTGQEMRAARVKLDPDTSEAGAVEDLAGFVVTGHAPATVQVVAASARAAPETAAPAKLAAAPASSVPEAAEASSPTSGLRVASYITAGVGVAALVFGGVELARKSSADSDFDAIYPKAHDTGDPAAVQQAADDQSRASSASTLSTVGFIVGGAAVVTGVVLFVVSGHHSAVQPTVAFDGRQTTIALLGTF